jgi:hypothetical protein
MYKFATKIDCLRLPIVTQKMSFINRTRLPVIIGTGLVLRVLALLNNASIEIDGIQYAKTGEAFARGRFGDALNNVFSPGYPLFIGLFHLVVPDLELAARMVSVFFGTLLIWLSFSFGKKVLEDSDKALWLSFLVAFHPYLIRYSGEALSESLATFLFTLTVFCFYLGWQENRHSLIAFSGLCLAFTYLTRPEYIVYYAPLTLLLFRNRRIKDTAILVSPVLLLGSLYVLYLHSQTGLWIVSNKVLLSPFVSVSVYFSNIPIVCFSWIMAIFPFFLILALAGLKRVKTSYTGLIFFVVLFHVLSLSSIGHSTKRYSVEFIPVFMVFSVQGIYAALGYMGRFVQMRKAYLAIISVIILLGGLVAHTPFRHDRLLHKQAGLFLASHDPGSTIAARLPIVAFYGKGIAVDFLSEIVGDKSPEYFKKVMTEGQVKYLVVERDAERELPLIKDILSDRAPIWSASKGHDSLRVYRIP